MLKPVLLSGGAGSRLWPVSRQLHPKPFISLTSASTLLGETLARLEHLPQAGPPMIVCHQEHRFLVSKQLRDGGWNNAQVLLEPCGRNTAPALALAALNSAPEDLLLVMPVDHWVEAPKLLGAAARAAMPIARSRGLVVFGVHPNSPEPGYGHILKGRQLPEADGAWQVERYVEKPATSHARQLTDTGRCLWSCGIFMLQAGHYLDILQQHAPDILAACRKAWRGARRRHGFVMVEEASFAACRADSIDYAVMEKTSGHAVVELKTGWSDLGNWSSLWELSQRDKEGNATHGDVVLDDVRHSYVRSESRMVAALGVEGLAIVETPDAVLVANRDRSQHIRQLVDQLKRRGRPEADNHRKVSCPWGSYEALGDGPGFQVKRLVIHPGQELSLQRHRYRSEHWVVVHGQAQVVCDENDFSLAPGQSTFIPAGAVHRLSNAGKEDLQVIEVQIGDYLGEDDIERLEDRYGRKD